MGYTTEFRGEFKITPSLNYDQVNYLKRFSETRRMKRDPSKITLADPLREAVGLPLGKEAEFFTGSLDRYGQDWDSPDVVATNYPPSKQPDLWCQWIPSDDGSVLKWDEGEKFYDYVTWLQYMIDEFFVPWRKTLNGVIDFRGEDWDDHGSIIVKDNKIEVE